MTLTAPTAREFPRWRMQAGWASACPWWSSTPSSPGFGLSSSRRFIRGDKKVLTARIRMERWTSFKKWHSSIPKHEGKESNQRETSRTWEDKQPWDSGIPSFLSVFYDVEAIICNQLELVKVSNYLPGSDALYHLDLPLVLPEAKVHHRLGRLLQRVPAATFLINMETFNT